MADQTVTLDEIRKNPDQYRTKKLLAAWNTASGQTVLKLIAYYPTLVILVPAADFGGEVDRTRHYRPDEYNAVWITIRDGGACAIDTAVGDLH